MEEPPVDDDVEDPPVEEDVDDPPVDVEDPPVDVDEPPVDVEEPPVDVEPPLELDVEEITIPPGPPRPAPPKNPPAKKPPPPKPPPPMMGAICPPPETNEGAIGTGASCDATVTTVGTQVAGTTLLRTRRLLVGRFTGVWATRLGAAFATFLVKFVRAFCVSAT